MIPAARPIDPATWRRVLILIFGTCLLVRVLHLVAAVSNPLMYHPGPDEDYYLRFGAWMAGLAPGDPAEFAFMDPAYGFILGGVFKLLGQNKVAVLALQALLDTSSCLLVALCGRELGRPRAGLVGAGLYALAATAVMYSATFLKSGWVANALILWVFLGLVLLRQQRSWPWLLFGVYCGYCVALRGNLLLMLPVALLLLPWLCRSTGSQRRLPILRPLLLLAGMAIPLLALSVRHADLSGKFSPLPNNGGIVLHQVYNSDNPRAESWYPPFSSYSNPTDIARGYAAEARRRTGQELGIAEVDDYWRNEALQYMKAKPANVAASMARKALEFSAHTEVANNRSLAEERLFSPVLRALPSPFGWLFALGIPGLLLLTWQDRRGWLIIAPLLVVLLTFSVFFAEARFRFHALPLLALGSGVLIEQLLALMRSEQYRSAAFVTATVLLFSAVSAWATRQVPEMGISWDAIAWGYIKMGDLPAAEQVLKADHPGMEITDKWEEALGLMQWSQGNLEAAAKHYRRATELNPSSHVAHFNLALSLQRIGDIAGARHHAATAARIAALPEYIALQRSLGDQ